MYFSGILRISGKFRMHYFVPHLVKKGNTIIDIGANLGYYTRIFAGAAGTEGSVWAVEPVQLYREVLRRNTSKCPNVKILPYALGDKQRVEYMGIPGSQPYRHGLTRIIDNDKDNNKNASVRVEVKTPGELFAALGRVDYIKCDIEGYENRVIPGFAEIIKRDRPLIQIELSPANRDFINDLLSKEGYISYTTDRKKLRRISTPVDYKDDILYIHKDKHKEIQKFHK